MITRGSIHLLLFVLSSALFSHIAVVSSWSHSSELLKHRKLLHHPSIAIMSAGTSDDVGDAGGSLLLSNIRKIGLSSDESSKLRVLLASQSPRRREILVSIHYTHVESLMLIIIPSRFYYWVLYALSSGIQGHDGTVGPIYSAAFSAR